jgi:hypothetical protein
MLAQDGDANQQTSYALGYAIAHRCRNRTPRTGYIEEPAARHEAGSLLLRPVAGIRMLAGADCDRGCHHPSVPGCSD